MSGSVTAGRTIRAATEADHGWVTAVADEWFAGRRVRHLLPRAWFRHFGSTSVVATDATGHPCGILVGFLSPDHPAEAVIHLLAVHPNQRRRGIGRELVEAFRAGAAAHGRSVLTTVCWPDEPGALGFLRAVGFVPDTGPDTRRVYGQPAVPDYDGDGEDRVVLRRPIG